MPNSCHSGKSACCLFHRLLTVCCPALSCNVTRGTRIDTAAQQNCIFLQRSTLVETGWRTRRRMYFASDNTAGMAPEILAALGKANTGYALGYGNDEWTKRVERRFAELFGKDVAVF